MTSNSSQMNSAEKLIEESKAISNAVYLACDESVAKHVSSNMIKLTAIAEVAMECLDKIGSRKLEANSGMYEFMCEAATDKIQAICEKGESHE